MQAALFNTSSTLLPFIGQGNFTHPVDPCIASNFLYADVEYDLFTAIDADSGSSAVFPQVWLTTGSAYTLVVSTSANASFANFGATISPTIYSNLGSMANFASPNYDVDPSGCLCELEC